MEDLIKCPLCSSTQCHVNKQGFSGGKAVAGALLAGGVGVLAGTIGSNKVKITCLKCGHVFNPGDKPLPKISQEDKDNAGKKMLIVFTIIIVIVTILAIVIKKT